MSISTQLIIACWIVFIGYWSISARGIKPVAERPNRLTTLVYRVPVTVGGLLLWPKEGYPFTVALTPHTDLTRAIGAVVCVLGLVVAIWSRRILAGNWSSEVTFKEGHELIQTGPYRFVRHPIYTGLLLMCLGSAIPEGRVHSWLGLMIMFAGLWIKLRQEESLMLRHFPVDYPSYRSRVKALVPFII